MLINLLRPKYIFNNFQCAFKVFKACSFTYDKETKGKFSPTKWITAIMKQKYYMYHKADTLIYEVWFFVLFFEHVMV